MDGLETVKICIGYHCPEKGNITTTPVGAEGFARVKPQYLELPGWSESTFGATNWDELPENARAYIEKIEEIVGVPVDIVSTGPDRVETITRRDPFEI
jgi:adenylosuccinate synthase